MRANKQQLKYKEINVPPAVDVNKQQLKYKEINIPPVIGVTNGFHLTCYQKNSEVILQISRTMKTLRVLLKVMQREDFDLPIHQQLLQQHEVVVSLKVYASFVLKENYL